MDNELPAEIIADIRDKATEYSKGDISRFVGYTTIATEYATKMHDRDKKIELLMKSRQNQTEFIDKAIALLEKFISRHEGGLLPDRLLYTEIKQFLDALKEILKQGDYYSAIDLADKALSAGEDRICPNCKKVFNADRHGNCRECGSDEYNKQKEDK
jgi:hypothetical protein